MMIASLRILGAVIPFAILFKNKELQQTIHHLVQAFISLLRGKKDMTSSHDFRMSWRITVSFCAFLVSYTLADPGLVSGILFFF